MLTDGYGRRIDYLRLSVTDRCDLRCAYCRPQAGDVLDPSGHWLNFDEIDRLVGMFVSLGISRIRITGGEPLTRARICELISRLRCHVGLRDVSLSTNGTRLARFASQLRGAGVSRLNVSLDTLSRTRFKALTCRDALDQVLNGLAEARRCGFVPIKINMVWLPDINGDELDAMILFCISNGFILRLIEKMPMGDSSQLGTAPLKPLMEQLKKRYGLVDHLIPGGGPARYLATPDRAFSLGFITPISQHFCDTCNRIRLAADGTMRLCLAHGEQVNFRSLIRSGATDQEMTATLLSALQSKPERHNLCDKPNPISRTMARLGG